LKGLKFIHDKVQCATHTEGMTTLSEHVSLNYDMESCIRT